MPKSKNPSSKQITKILMSAKCNPREQGPIQVLANFNDEKYLSMRAREILAEPQPDLILVIKILALAQAIKVNNEAESKPVTINKSMAIRRCPSCMKQPTIKHEMDGGFEVFCCNLPKVAGSTETEAIANWNVFTNNLNLVNPLPCSHCHSVPNPKKVDAEHWQYACSCGNRTAAASKELVIALDCWNKLNRRETI